MIKDSRGQISMEYLLIFAVSLIIFIAFTLPLTEYTIQNTLDVSDSLDLKSDLSEISSAIGQVYSEGQGSKQTVNLDLKKSVRITVTNSYVSANVKLNDGSNKLIKVNCNSNLKSSVITLNKGENILLVEWPVNSPNIQISKKII